MREAELPDGTILEFPDGTPDEVMRRVVKQQLGIPVKPQSLAESNPAEFDPTSPEFQGGNIGNALGEGALFGFGDEIAGAGGAAVNSVANLFGKGTGDSFGEAYKGIRDAARENEAAFAARNPKTALAANVAGGLVTGGVGAAKAGAFGALKSAQGARKLIPIAKTGAIQGGLFGAGVSEQDSLAGVAGDALKGAGVGALAAPALPVVGGGLRAGVRKLSGTQVGQSFKDAVELVERKIGRILTTGQKTGSRSIKQAETTLADTFVGSSVAGSLDKSRRKFQGALMDMAGFGDDAVSKGLITREALDEAANRFSVKYRGLLGDTKVNLQTDEFIDDLVRIGQQHQRVVPALQKRQVGQIINDLSEEAFRGPMSANTYQKTRSFLSKKSRDQNFGDLYRDLKRALDDAFFASGGSKAGRAALDQQYGRFKQLQNAFESSGAQQSAGGVLPLSMVVRRAGKQPDREFEKLVRAGQQVLGDAVANSGTPARLFNSGAALGVAGSVATGNPLAAAGIIAGPAAVSGLLGRGITGSSVANKAIQSGLLAAPVANPFLRDLR